MGKASSAKKVARAARTGGGRTKRGTTSWVWPGLMTLVVLLGTAGIVQARNERQPDNTRPLPAAAGRAGDHWHSAIGFYICGAFTPNLPEGDDPLGIHGHGDNIVHTHPFGASSAGKRAKLSVYLDSVSADISTTKIELPGQEAKSNGDKCPDGKESVVQTKVWDTREASDKGRVVEGNPSDLLLKDSQLITVAFGPKGVDIPKPPSEIGLDSLSDVGAPTTTTTLPATTTTAAPTTTTTAAP